MNMTSFQDMFAEIERLRAEEMALRLKLNSVDDDLQAALLACDNKDRELERLRVELTGDDLGEDEAIVRSVLQHRVLPDNAEETQAVEMVAKHYAWLKKRDVDSRLEIERLRAENAELTERMSQLASEANAARGQAEVLEAEVERMQETIDLYKAEAAR